MITIEIVEIKLIIKADKYMNNNDANLIVLKE
jgi:hypothetical protein